MSTLLIWYYGTRVEVSFCCYGSAEQEQVFQKPDGLLRCSREKTAKHTRQAFPGIGRCRFSLVADALKSGILLNPIRAGPSGTNTAVHDAEMINLSLLLLLF